jgi:alanine racemase
MHSKITISQSAIQNNVRSIQNLVDRDRAVFILKSNAYGHGLREIFACVKELDIPFLGVNYVNEGVKLREWGYQGRIMMVGPFLKQDMQPAVTHRMELFLGDKTCLVDWVSRKDKPTIHVEFDTGMGRQGFLPSDAQSIIDQIKPFSACVRGVCMHFSNVEDVTEHEYADQQLEKFQRAYDLFVASGFKIERHAASSASAFILDNSRYDLCRIGISLYGFWPSQATKISYAQIHNKDLLSLKPALSWLAPVTSMTQVEAGQFIGYGCTFRARKAMSIAVIPVGYFEGYPRIASGSQAYVLIDGQRAPIVGRICMNMMMVDVSDIPRVCVGQMATLIGQDGAEKISASDVATWSQTIHYELVTRLNAEIPRVVV